MHIYRSSKDKLKEKGLGIKNIERVFWAFMQIQETIVYSIYGYKHYNTDKEIYIPKS